MAFMLYEMIGRLFSRTQMRRLGSLLESAGMDMVSEAFAGFLVVATAILAILLYLIVLTFEPLRGLLFKLSLTLSTELTVSSSIFVNAISVVFVLAASAGVCCLLAYVVLLLMADSRRRKVEDVLPEFLSLSAANVRAGMTIDQAMWYAAKPEFGILSEEVAIVAKKTFGGVPFNSAIDYLAERFNSKSMRRAVSLIKQGIASGGKMADILERTAEDSRQMQILHKEIAASLLMYIIFIVFASAIGTPFLFSISGKLVSILEGVFSQLPDQTGAAAATSGMQGGIGLTSKPAVSSSDFVIFTILSSLITAAFSALIIGVISKGSKKDGVPYMPFLVAASLGVYFLISRLLDTLLSNIYI